MTNRKNPNPLIRNSSGGYFTPNYLVRLDPLFIGCTTVQAWRVNVRENTADSNWIRRGSYSTLREARLAAYGHLEARRQARQAS